MCGCYDCQRAVGVTVKAHDVLDQKHNESDGRFVVKTKHQGGETYIDRRVFDHSAPTVPRKAVTARA